MSSLYGLIKSRKDDSFLQLQYFWTCFCVLVTFSMLLTETSEPLKSLLFCPCPGFILTTDWAKLI